MANVVGWSIAQQCHADVEEAALVRVARDDPEAFGELCRRYAPDLYRYLRLRTGSEDDAADLTQQVFVRALAALPRYRERGMPFGAWLFRIARNPVTDAYRRKHVTVSWDLMPEQLESHEAESVEEEVLRRETRVWLRSALDRLTEDEREVIALRFVTGLTLVEIAAVLGTSRSSVDRRIGRILRTLKEHHHED